MAKKNREIQECAVKVRDEKEIGKNTASRVGGVITDIADYIKDISIRTDDHQYALKKLSTLNVYDAGTCEYLQDAIVKALNDEELKPFMFITGFVSNEDSPFLIIGNFKNIFDNVTWEDKGEEEEGSGVHRYTLPFPCLVFESGRIQSFSFYIDKIGEDGEPFFDECFDGVKIMDHDEYYGDGWGMSMFDIKQRLSIVEEKLKKLTTGTTT